MNKQSLLSLYYSYIHCYINYANVAWGSTYITEFKKLSIQQKHAMRIICNKKNFEHTKQLFQSNKILSAYKLNILNVATFMYKVNQKTAPNIFPSRFQKLSHSYHPRFLELNYVQAIHNIKTSKYSISIRRPCAWNSCLGSEEKQVTTMQKFKATTISMLPLLENELAFSWRTFFHLTDLMIT